jgi:hypothetical protein
MPAPAASQRSEGCKCGGVQRAIAPSCGTIRVDVPTDNPDLAIYSQLEEIHHGRPPAWDNPDMVTNHWRPFRLMEEAKITIRNLSSVPAINVLVRYEVSPFGIGTKRVPKVSGGSVDRAIGVPA